MPDGARFNNCSAFIQTSENVSDLPTNVSVTFLSAWGVMSVINGDIIYGYVNQTLGACNNNQPLLTYLIPQGFWNYPPNILFNLVSANANISQYFYLNYTIQLQFNYITLYTFTDYYSSPLPSIVIGIFSIAVASVILFIFVRNHYRQRGMYQNRKDSPSA